MTFSATVMRILSNASTPMTPQEIKEVIKENYPEFFGSPSHIRNVEKGHYKNVDHALLAQIYSLVRMNRTFFCDETHKPMKISLKGEGKQPEMVEQPLRRRTHSKAKPYEERVKEILGNAEKYHEAYYKAETFRGPSLYFHQRALAARQSSGLKTLYLEYIYATLTSWGMHRMGKGGSKMQSFEIFSQSIEALRDNITEAQAFNIGELNEQKWSLLEEIFRGINVMASDTKIVGNSKAMHHLLPNIVPPIDREYTLYYLKGTTAIKNELTYEWQLMKDIISGFFVPIVSASRFIPIISNWLMRQNEFPWDTSPLKIVDNLIIGRMKSNETV